MQLKMMTPALAGLLFLTACGTAESGEPVDAAADSSDAYPVTVQNCGVDVTFEAPPESVLLVGRPEVAPTLASLGVLDRVTGRAGAFPAGYYDEEVNAVIQEVPSLSDDVDESGHLAISQEVVISAEPDLVVGLPDGISRESLAAVGIPVLEHPASCAQDVEDSDFDDVYSQVEMYGQVFDRNDEAEETVAELRDRVEAVTASTQDAPERTAAVLYPTVGGGSGYAYGALSMSHPQLEAAGFTNVFADVEERVFEVTTEELIARDPDVLIMLHSEGEPGPVQDAVTVLPGVGQMTAIADDDILVQLFGFSEYPSLLSVEGLERIAEHFGTDQ